MIGNNSSPDMEVGVPADLTLATGGRGALSDLAGEDLPLGTIKQGYTHRG